MKNIGIGIIFGILIALIYHFAVIKPGNQKTSDALKKKQEQLASKIDSLYLVTALHVVQSKEYEEIAESYAEKEKEALIQKDLEHQKYLDLKRSIPKTIKECLDDAQVAEGHLLTEIINADIAFAQCDSARTSYKLALVECKKIPNINTGIGDIIEDVNRTWEKRLAVEIKQEKNKGNKKAGIFGVVLLLIGLAL